MELWISKRHQGKEIWRVLIDNLDRDHLVQLIAILKPGRTIRPEKFEEVGK